MRKETLVVATRESPLALKQTALVVDSLQKIFPSIQFDVLGLTTMGDTMLDNTLFEKGGKSLFVKELEQALLEKRADFAVHSMKDVPIDLPPGLLLAAITERADPRDAFVSNRYACIEDLPTGAVVGTASLRRQALLKAYRADLPIRLLRGNVNTRLRKMDEGEFDAIVLAVAGLKRLGLDARIRSILPIDWSLPAVGQGAIGIECRAEDVAVIQILSALHHVPTAQCVLAERAMNRQLGGGCHVPIAGHAVIDDGGLWLRGWVSCWDGRTQLSDQLRGAATDYLTLGEQLGRRLLDKGAATLLAMTGNQA